ncbi:MAG: hypothetical protein QI199_06120 [Candidatus Korarchaeota archaeon]|nr:hypothetical protein [Candidatus Korarchaeota archaeon]
MAGRREALEHLYSIIRVVEEQIRSLRKAGEARPVSMMAEALLNLWEAFDELVSAGLKGLTGFYIQWILPRYIYEINMAFILCMREAVSASLNAAARLLEASLVLDHSEEYIDLRLEEKIEKLLYMIEDPKRLEELVEKHASTPLLKLVKQYRRELAEDLRGQLQLMKIFKEGPSPSIFYVPPCTEAEEEAESISTLIEDFASILRNTPEDKHHRH